MESIRGRDQRQSRTCKPLNSVAVGVARDLPNVPKEIACVARIWGSGERHKITQPLPRPAEVLKALETCDMFQFAGHGHSNLLDPLRSAIILANQARLEVLQLLEIDLRRRQPFLAYLSACGTGRIRNTRFADEGLHLMVSFQLAGLRHVIGTLWDVADDISADLASLVYQRLQKHGLNDETVSEALHFATIELRDQWVVTSGISVMDLQEENAGPRTQDRASHDILRPIELVDEPPLNWVPWVHFGL